MQTSPVPGPTAGPRGRARTGRTPRLVAGVLIAVSTTLLAGCGFDVQTNEVYQPAVGANQRSGTVDVLAAVIISDQKGKGVFLATLVDNSDTEGDRLVSISGADGVEPVSTQLGTPDLAPQTPVNLADSGGIAVTGQSIDAETSAYVEMTLTFANSDAVTVNTPVYPPDGPYADFDTPSSPNSVAAQGATGGAS